MYFKFSDVFQDKFPLGNEWSSFITQADSGQKTIFNFYLGANPILNDVQELFTSQGIEARNVILTLPMETLFKSRKWKEWRSFLFKSIMLRAVSHLTLIVTVSISHTLQASNVIKF
jgi:hypothetical protein